MKNLILTLLISATALTSACELIAGAVTGSRNKCFPVVRRYDAHATLTYLSPGIPPIFQTYRNPSYHCTFASSSTITYNGGYAYARVGQNVSTIRTTVSKWNAIAGQGYYIPSTEPPDSYGWSKGDNGETVTFDSANHSVIISDFNGYISATLGTGYGCALLYVVWLPASEDDSVITVNEVLSKGSVYLENGQLITTGFFSQSDFNLTIEPDSSGLIPIIKGSALGGLLKTIPIDSSISLDSIKVSVYCEGGYGMFHEDDIIKPEHTTLAVKILMEGYYDELSDLMRRGDSAKIYIRDLHQPYLVYDSASVLIDGYGNGTAYMFRMSPTYVSTRPFIQTRKCISIWGTTEFDSSLSHYNLDFSLSPTSVYGGNVSRVGLPPYRYAMYSGDVNQDETIDATDLSLIDNDASGFVSGDVLTDLTGDLFVDGTDFLIADNNATRFVSVIYP